MREGAGVLTVSLSQVTLEKEDRIEIWIKNITDTNDITSIEGGSVTISERAP